VVRGPVACRWDSLVSGHHQLNTQPLRCTLENFDEVAGRFRGTPYVWMLD